ncbi:MAG: hypothetical protein COZ38_04850, partial [Rhodocyclales bacterium CG_4_10_14_3_um_filter_68_10]
MPPDAAFGNLADWQAMLDRHQPLFADMTDGSRLGLLAGAAAALPPGRHVAGLREASGAGAAMLAWEARAGRMRAGLGEFAGFEAAGVDLLFVAGDEALAALRASLEGDPLAVMKRMIRRGELLFYVLKARHELQEAGYEDFLDSLG